jgi:hypothetical protein
MNEPNDLDRLQQLSEKTGIEMVVIDEAEKIINAHADHLKRRLIRHVYAVDPIKSSIHQQSPKIKTVLLPGISFVVNNEGTEELLSTLNTKFAHRNCLAFISSDSYSEETIVVSIICTADKYNILRFQQLSGGSYEFSTENIISNLQQFEKKYPFEIIGTALDWCLVKLKELPTDWIDLSREVLKVCPTEENTPNGFAEALKADKGKLFLWWD